MNTNLKIFSFLKRFNSLYFAIIGLSAFLCFNSSGTSSVNNANSLFKKKSDTTVTPDSTNNGIVIPAEIPKDSNSYTNYASKTEPVLLNEYNTSSDDISKNGLPVYDMQKLNTAIQKTAALPYPLMGAPTTDETSQTPTTTTTGPSGTTTASGTTQTAVDNNTVAADETIPGALNTIFTSVESKLPENVKNHANTIRNIWTAVGPSARTFFASAMTLADKFGASDQSKNILGTVGHLIFGIRSNTDAAKKGSLIIKGFTGLSSSVLGVVAGIRERLQNKFTPQTTEDQIVDKTKSDASGTNLSTSGNTNTVIQ